jgi:tRNA U34 2-thiouridine synthase MnmA/TrmU
LIVKAVSLFSGGLDSILAVKIIQDQGISVAGLTFSTPFFSAEKAQTTAARIGLPLRVFDLTTAHLAMLKAPRYGYGKNMNPCIDCHTLMIHTAGKIMAETGADFIITGEVLGQRPMSQTRQSLHIVAKNSGYGDYVLRPLSARLLPESEPERSGKVNRGLLLSIQGRSRKPQMELAAHYGIQYYPPPAGGCLLTDPMFSRRLKDLFVNQPDPAPRDMELLKYGRHFRLAAAVKVIVGRNERDNLALQTLIREGDAVLKMVDVPGPLVLVPGGGSEEDLRRAARLCVLYSDAPPDRESSVKATVAGKTTLLTVSAADRDEAARAIL